MKGPYSTVWRETVGKLRLPHVYYQTLLARHVAFEIPILTWRAIDSPSTSRGEKSAYFECWIDKSVPVTDTPSHSNRIALSNRFCMLENGTSRGTLLDTRLYHTMTALSGMKPYGLPTSATHGLLAVGTQRSPTCDFFTICFALRCVADASFTRGGGTRRCLKR